jgi:hypothetical protein
MLDMKAVLITVDWENKRVLADFFKGKNCIEDAQRMRAALRDDFPCCEHAIIPDEEANLAHNFVYQMTRDA